MLHIRLSGCKNTTFILFYINFLKKNKIKFQRKFYLLID